MSDKAQVGHSVFLEGVEPCLGGQATGQCLGLCSLPTSPCAMEYVKNIWSAPGGGDRAGSAGSVSAGYRIEVAG